ncbi:hypothetical protein [Fimbriiglobus ruber]|uniref:Uncharacterized protein n=1 Tax=Fimbriiglobus ruber TaxID=1908690 RepID=A0A225DK52_9BACT|nr:hypothetical protein [Fimbriiglobus ruber]OWK36537.1 hypothetical protein FRUB_09100 [Fimbriiglobus ruber]
MAVDWVLNLPCRPKETLGDGDFLAGTDTLLACLKAGNRAAVIADMARQQGNTPEGTSIVVRVARADGQVEDQPVRYDDLVAQSQRLDPLAPACEGCPANVPGRPFGCVGVVNYPIPRAVEEWLAGRFQPSTAVGGKLFLAAIRDFSYTGQPIRQFRAGGLFESDQPIKKKLKGGFFSSESVTTDQLFQALFCVGEPLDPGHCLGVLLWLGCIRLDGTAVETPEQAAIVTQLVRTDERRQRTELVTGADLPVEGVSQFESFLSALYRSWLLDVTLWVSA